MAFILSQGPELLSAHCGEGVCEGSGEALGPPAVQDKGRQGQSNAQAQQRQAGGRVPDTDVEGVRGQGRLLGPPPLLPSLFLGLS